MNRILYLYPYICYAVAVFGCHAKNAYNIDFEQKKATTGNVQFYFRGKLSDDSGYITYQDALAITKYRNKSLSIKEFYEIARDYVDTVKADLPVSAVWFICPKQGQELPTINNKLFKWEKLSSIASFGFDSGLKEKPIKRTLK